jgi:hypothetical protein
MGMDGIVASFDAVEAGGVVTARPMLAGGGGRCVGRCEHNPRV